MTSKESFDKPYFCEQHGRWESQLTTRYWVEKGVRDRIGYLLMCPQAVVEMEQQGWKVSQT